MLNIYLRDGYFQDEIAKCGKSPEHLRVSQLNAVFLKQLQFWLKWLPRIIDGPILKFQQKQPNTSDSTCQQHAPLLLTFLSGCVPALPHPMCTPLGSVTQVTTWFSVLGIRNWVKASPSWYCLFLKGYKPEFLMCLFLKAAQKKVFKRAV